MVNVLSPTSGVMVVECFLQKSGNTLKRSQPETVLECCAHLAEKLTDQPVSQVDVYSEESVLKKNWANQRNEYVRHGEGCSGIAVKVPRTGKPSDVSLGKRVHRRSSVDRLRQLTPSF